MANKVNSMKSYYVGDMTLIYCQKKKTLFEKLVLKKVVTEHLRHLAYLYKSQNRLSFNPNTIIIK